MARNRRRALEAREAHAAAAAAELRFEARRWWIRAVLAAVAAGAISLVTVVVAVVLGVLAVFAVLQGFRLALDAQRIEDAAA
ncbi:MAG TPA: hypothetical protein VD931_17145 [Baekduia sp.]|nr:hypothetical protein [Baekduia sp.]